MNKTLTYLVFISLFTCLIASCKSDPKMESNSQLSEKERSIKADSMKLVEQFKQNGDKVDGDMISQKLRGQNSEGTSVKVDADLIPDACEMLKAKLVADEFDVREADILISNGQRRKSNNNSSKSCFWRWTGGGILIQISRNPLPDEIPNWTEKYMSSKRSSGERNIENGKTVQYEFKEFDGPGAENLYSHELGRYYSVFQEKYVVSLIFNNNMKETKQKAIAITLLKNVMFNLGSTK